MKLPEYHLKHSWETAQMLCQKQKGKRLVCLIHLLGWT